MRFDIQPYVGALPVAFGMHQMAVHGILGAPDRSFPIWDKSGFSESYLKRGYNVGYDNEWCVKHVGFGPCAINLSILGQDIWTEYEQSDPNPTLLAFDPFPLEIVGFWVYPKIGVTTTGYHDDDPAQLAITVFPLGSKAELLANAQPADVSKYTRKDVGIR